MNITGLDASAGLNVIGAASEKNGNITSSFKDMLSNAIENTEELQAVSQSGTDALLSGQTDDIAQVMIDMQKAEISLNLVVEVRNKVVDAYNQIMTMQV